MAGAQTPRDVPVLSLVQSYRPWNGHIPCSAIKGHPGSDGNEPVSSEQVHGQSNFVARSNWVGIHALPATRAPRDVRGRVLDVKFRISDPRPGNASGKYEVAVRLEVSSF